MDHYERLYEMYDAALERKVSMMNSDDLENPQCAEHMDYWLHSMKSLKTIMAMDEAEGGSYGRRGYREGGYREGGYGNYREGGGSGGGSGGSSGGGYGGYGARGRRARRDSMGRYAAGDEEYIQKLEKLMEEAPNDQMRQSIQRALEEAQRM